MVERLYSFENLEVYKQAREFVKEVYMIQKGFPSEERYALCDQIRRAAVSITSNIAEGMSRQSNKEKIHFLEISYGSLMEVLSQLQIALDLSYIDDNIYRKSKEKIQSIGYLLYRLRKSLNDNS